MKEHTKKLRHMLFLSNSKKIVILSVTGLLLIGGLFPAINNVFIKDTQDPDEPFGNEYNNNRNSSCYVLRSYLGFYCANCGSGGL